MREGIQQHRLRDYTADILKYFVVLAVFLRILEAKKLLIDVNTPLCEKIYGAPADMRNISWLCFCFFPSA